MGEELDLTVGPIAHGGHCVARHDSLVVFVRHALPGERVRARVTAGAVGDRYVFADAIRVEEPSAHRVTPPCPYARPGGCGGCDFQHADLAYQRELKTVVLAEQLTRLGGLGPDVTDRVRVEPLPDRTPGGRLGGESAGESGGPSDQGAAEADGLRWRTRLELAVDRQGRAGLHPHRSRAVLPVEDCLIARPEIAAGMLARRYPRASAVHAVVSSAGERAVIAAPQGLRRTPTIHEVVRVGGREVTFRLNALGFWQVHPAAAETFAADVLAGLAPRPGERCLDLYAGVGLFARALADAVGPTGRVIAVESDPRACRAAAEHFADDPHVEVVGGRVEQVLDAPDEGWGNVDLVVLDPPRAGAGRAVLDAVARLAPRAIAYVACDPAALGRDLALASGFGYEIAKLTAYDAFPMTHHLEAIAILRRTTPADPVAVAGG